MRETILCRRVAPEASSLRAQLGGSVGYCKVSVNITSSRSSLAVDGRRQLRRVLGPGPGLTDEGSG